MSKRVWKPLDVNGLRLYRVIFCFPSHKAWDIVKIVAAKSPTHARQLMEEAYKGTMWIEEPIIDGAALNVYQPVEWWEGSDVRANDS